MRPRDAPSDRRMAISRCRTVARESIRLARFAAAVNSTRPNATISGVKARSTLNDSAIGVAAGWRIATTACVSGGLLAVVRCAQASTAARADAFGLRGAEASDHFEPLRLFGPEEARPLFERGQQRQRRPEVAGEQVQADEAFGSDADNLDVDAANLQLLTDRCRVAAKEPHPRGVAEDDDRLAPGGLAVRWSQHASTEGRDAEQGEVVARDQLAHGRPPVDARQQLRHGDVRLGEDAGHVAAEPRGLRPREPMEKASAVLPGRLIQRSGIMHGGRLDDVGVEKRVGGCVEAERHGQRPNNGQSDRWRTLEDAEREPDVSPERLKAHTRLRRLSACRCFSS